MLDALERFMPEGSRWTRPKGGLFLWVTLPGEIDTLAMMSKAIENNVAYVPGSAFYAENGLPNTFRLNFSNAQPDQIDIGIRRLGEVIAKELAGESTQEPVFA
jgi:2-aminoadipate transaminase